MELTTLCIKLPFKKQKEVFIPFNSQSVAQTMSLGRQQFANTNFISAKHSLARPHYSMMTTP
ncbi:MAG: hypothetical protein L0387_20610 [Acidobacteria bacterium]|nr:hypothetical protein [Acidobacteriota bacterium]MCI0723531.1 hypothetical protein [Acidobacteriota bacterium]